MKLLIFYRPDSEHESLVQAYVRDFQRQHEVGRKIELISLDTREGASKAAMYDLMDFPAILATTEDGSVLNSWQGTPLPLMSEVAGYAYNG